MNRRAVERPRMAIRGRGRLRVRAIDDLAIATWPARLAGRSVVVAVDERDAPIGFRDVWPDRHIDQFFVHADHQRRGVGRAVLATLLAEAHRRRRPA